MPHERTCPERLQIRSIRNGRKRDNAEAADLLIDAAAFAISENGGTLDEAIERLKESVETFRNTSAVTH